MMPSWSLGLGAGAALDEMRLAPGAGVHQGPAAYRFAETHDDQIAACGRGIACGRDGSQGHPYFLGGFEDA